MNKKIASEIAVGIVLLVAVAIGGIFWLQNKKVQPSIPQQVVSQSETSVKNNSEQIDQAQTCSDNFHRACSDGSYIGDCTQTCPAYDLSSLNPELWSKYTNEKLGFSMMIPKNNQINDKAYPVVVTEKNSDVTIATKNPPKGYSSSDTSFVIKIRSAKNDEDINRLLATDFLKNGACVVDRRDASLQDGVFDLTVAANEQCLMNYAYVLRYDPIKQLVAFWMMGQSGHFYQFDKPDNVGNSLEGVDGQMASSFQFLKENSDETANWQTYSNAKYGFEFKYPPSGYEFHVGNPKADEPQFFVKNSNDLDKSYYALDLDILPNDTQKNFEARIHEAQKTGQNYVATTVDGKLAYKNVYNDITVYAILDNETSFNIVIKNNDIGDKIISTLKLIK